MPVGPGHGLDGVPEDPGDVPQGDPGPEHERRRRVAHDVRRDPGVADRVSPSVERLAYVPGVIQDELPEGFPLGALQ